MVGKWCFGKSLPDIHRINQQEEATVGEVWSPQGWNLTFRRFLFDWEMGRMVELYKMLEQFTGTADYEDQLIWQGHKNGNFSVSSAYKKFNTSNYVLES